MSVTTAAGALILSSTITESIDNIDVISISDSGGEVLRKVPLIAVETVSSVERKYTFYFTETEPATETDIVSMSLYGNGATVTLGDGTEMATQTVEITKTTTSSLLIYWNVAVNTLGTGAAQLIDGGTFNSTYDGMITGGGF